MNQKSRAFAVAAALLAASFATGPSVAQKQGGILKIYMLDSPASMSVHEEATVVAERPVMGVFNNLVMFDQLYNKTAWARSSPISLSAGHGTRMGQT